MRKCTCCKQDEAKSTWQPFGPGETINTFTMPGSHYRGFAALPICDNCQAEIESGRIFHFTYKQTAYIASQGVVNATSA